MNQVIAWVDVESSGTLPESDTMLEVGAVLTGMDGVPLTSPYHALVEPVSLSRTVASCSPDVRRMHERSGLWADLWRDGGKEVRQVDDELCEWLQVQAGASVLLGGNSVTLDRGFLRSNLPGAYRRLSHMSVDVTSLSLALHACMDVPRFVKHLEHRALPDAQDSRREYVHYRRLLSSLAAPLE